MATPKQPNAGPTPIAGPKPAQGANPAKTWPVPSAPNPNPAAGNNR